jgi:hypothetical protein
MAKQKGWNRTPYRIIDAPSTTRTDLAKHLAVKHDIPLKQAQALLKTLVRLIQNDLVEGRVVVLRGLGRLARGDLARSQATVWFGASQTLRKLMPTRGLRSVQGKNIGGTPNSSRKDDEEE